MAGIGQGTHKFLGRLGNRVIQCVDFVLPIFFFFFFLRGEVIQKKEETAELSYFLLSTTWLLLPFIKKFLVYFLGNIDFATTTENKNRNGEYQMKKPLSGKVNFLLLKENILTTVLENEEVPPNPS